MSFGFISNKTYINKVIAEKNKTDNPMEVFELAIKNASPNIEVRSRRIGGANYQVPREVRPERRLSLAMHRYRDW